MGYVTALADLAAPKAALPLLHDPQRLTAFEAAMFAALEKQPGDTLPSPQLILYLGLAYFSVVKQAPIHQ